MSGSCPARQAAARCEVHGDAVCEILRDADDIVPPLIRAEGMAHLSEATAALGADSATRARLFGAVPAGTTIAFALPRAGKVELSIYDVAGRRIARVLEGDLPAGGHRVAWNGRDDAGRPVAGGVYFYEVVQGGERSSKRMVVLAR